ncbi:MAG: serine/threonine-protein kinase [Thermoflexales bacterium]
MTSRTFGKYEVIRSIGTGGMGEVFVARDPALNRLVAIKAVHAHLAADATFGARFAREARIIAQLDHPNIVPVYDFDGEHSPPYMVMPLISGNSLRERLAERRQSGQRGLPFDEAARILSAVAAALDTAHAKGVIHRDIKPGNILLSVDGGTRLADFGIAKIIDESANAQQLSLPDSTIGTAAYMSPEQAAGKPVEARSDIYSLGAVLYEMVTGRPPFKGTSASAVVMMHVTETPPDARTINPLVPPSAAVVLARALAKQPGDRPATARAIAEAFAASLTVSPADDPNAGDAATLPETPAVVPDAARSAPRAMPANNGSLPPPIPADLSAPGAANPPAMPAARARHPARLALIAGAGGLVLIGVTAIFLRGTPAPTVPPTAPPEATLAAASATAIPATASSLAPLESAAVPTPTATSAPSAAEPRYGELRIGTAVGPGPGSVLVRLDNVALPVSGTRYVLWSGASPPLQRMGVLTVENARIRQILALPIESVEGMAQAIITYETDPLTKQPSSRVAFVAAASRDTVIALKAAAGGTTVADPKGGLEAAEEQLAIAVEHQGLLQRAIQAGDLREMRRHAEHTVNIIEGKSGPLFGDLDRNGVTENPGDDVGVKTHVANLRGRAPDDTRAALDEVTSILQETISLAVKVLSVDKVADGAKFADQGAALLRTLSSGAGGEAKLAGAATRLPNATDVPLLRGAAYPKLPAADTAILPALVISSFSALVRPTTGVLSQAEGQYLIVAQHMGFMERSLASGNVAESRQHGEHITNILEGAKGKRFGDRNGNGRIENPGDGVGVAGYIERALEAAASAPANFYVIQFGANATRTLELIDAASATASRMAAADTQAELLRLIPALRDQLKATLVGDDRDRDGIIEPLFSEGGLRSIRNTAAAAASPH